MRILYVEDVLPNSLLIERIARMGDHTVINYISAEEAIANFERDNPDIMLVDIRLDGDMDGVEFIRYMRDRGCTTPMIAVTAYMDYREECLLAGADEFYVKPIPVRSLWRMLQRYDHSGEVGV
ncbi:MAG: response regulator [Chloroflexi bacterium]|nr:response regulator [Chloroflexota bacterium]